MKKLLLIGATVASTGVFAQNWVDTVPKNRNVVLEEFTGIRCGYCPDGHRIANEMVAANPGRVFLINVHAGGYATPAAGEPDFRTTAGTAIDGASGVTGYPAGSINRAATPWASSRTAWTNQANTILGQTSPVNVAVKANVDFTTRQLTAEVEVYYTSNSPATKNFLTVALTQDDILGPQSDFGNYNPTNWVNGQYRHNHVLRQLLTSSTFGDAIDTTTKGTYVYRKFTTTLPESINNVKLLLSKLNVVAFVAQANNNILSAAGTEVEYDNALKADLSVRNLTVAPTSLCATTVNPKIEVTNLSGKAVTAFKVTATVNNVKYSKVVSGNFANNDKVTVDWGNITLTNGGNYSISFGNIDSVVGATNNPLFDIDLTNDGASASGMAFMDAVIPPSYVWCGFENMVNTGLDLSENSGVAIPSSTTNYGSYSARALRFSLHSSWNLEGKPAHVYVGKVNLSTLTQPGVSYNYAYSDGSQGGTAPTVTLKVSKDCGATWATVNTTTAEETGQPADANSFYVPKTTDYKIVRVDLDAYKTDNVLVKISVTPGSSGNAFYLDGIAFNSFTKLGINDAASDVNYEMYPNPAKDNFTVKLAKLSKDASVAVRSIDGKLVKTVSLSNVENNIDCSELTNGIYLMEVTVDGNTATEKLVIAK